MPYPPGVSTRSLKRAGIIQAETPTCGECGETIRKIDDHEAWCDYKEAPEEIIKRQNEPPGYNQ